MPGSCQAELLAELLAEDERDLLDHQSKGELKHSLFTVATSKLKKKHREDFEARGLQLNDPESEGFLRYAEPTAIAKSDLSCRALCVDVYTSESLHVEPTPAKRKVKMIQQITAAWEKNKDGATPPHKRGVCSEANLRGVHRCWRRTRGCTVLCVCAFLLHGFGQQSGVARRFSAGAQRQYDDE